MKEIGSFKQLFVDDYLVEASSGLTWGFHPPEKYGANPILQPEDPWEGELVQANEVFYDSEQQLYRMWYGGGHWCNYATSADGIAWDKANLGIKEHEGSTANNLIDGIVGRIVYTPEMRGTEPPERLYKTFYDAKYIPDKDPGGGWRGKIVSFSEDGLRWVPHDGGNPVIVGALGDVNSVVRIPENVLHRFALDPMPEWLKKYEKGYKFYHSFLPRYLALVKLNVRIGHFDRRAVGITYSENFTEWSYPQLVLAPDERDDELAYEQIEASLDLLKWDDPKQRHSHFYGMDVFPYAGMYLGFLNIFDSSMEMEQVGGSNQAGIMYIQLVASRDLVHWNRVGDRKPFIAMGGLDDIDCGMIAGAHAVVAGDTIRYYYSAISGPHGGRDRKDGKPVSCGVCLATSRLDGFASVGADGQGGHLTTKAFTFEGNALTLNADASCGSVGVEILRDDGPVKGFSRTDCRALSTDDVSHTVSWNRNTDVGSLSGTTVRLRFHLENAKLYSFQFMDGPTNEQIAAQ
ncbi:MAG: hypothetical protein CMJ18_10285 [Phycisphaeraceae bacterium]|nr:hypothetical protein [Phycisphaeraceae bacterium]